MVHVKKQQLTSQKGLIVFILFILFLIGKTSAQNWRTYDANVLPQILGSNWYERGTSGDTPGVLDLFSIVTDASNNQNKLLRILETGTTAMREKIAFDWAVNSSVGTTVVFRAKGTGEQARGGYNQSFYLEIADGHVREIIKGVRESDGTTKLLFESDGNTITLDINTWHIFRFTISPTGLITLYVDESASPRRSYNCTTASTYNYIAIGDPSTDATFKQYIDYIMIAEGALSPSAAPMPLPNQTTPSVTQTITFNPLPIKTFGDADFSAGATASSGLAISLVSSNTAVATIVGGNIHIVGAGTCTITASQAGDANYIVASPVSQTLTVSKANQTLTFPVLPTTKKAGDPDFNAGAAASSGLAVSLLSSNTAVATIVGGNIHIVGAGFSFITASQAGNANYNVADSIGRNLYVLKGDQTITFPALSTKYLGDTDFIAGATASSGLAISLASSNTAVATIVGGNIHIVGAGTCDITASQDGDVNFNAASASQALNVIDAPIFTLPASFEAENLVLTSSIASAIATNQAGASNLSYAQFSDAVTPVVGSWIQFTLPVAVADTYNLKFYFKGATSRGICQGSVDGVNMGGVCDQYSSANTMQVEFNMGDKFLTAGNHTIRFTVTGKNSASSGYKLTFDYFKLSEVVPVVFDPTWKYLSGPEEENGDNIIILSNTNGNILLNVEDMRGHVVREITPTSLPAEITFNWRSKYDPTTSEPPTELWGTGDFRISVVGMPKGLAFEKTNESNLGIMEGVQFRIHPHYTGNEIRRCTNSDNEVVDCDDPDAEPHTASSIWTRYTDPNRILGDNGDPHTGLQSDACQNRNSEDYTHNCGWAREAIVPGGFAMKNNTPGFIKINISSTEAKMYCTYMDGTQKIERTIRVPLTSSDIRFDMLSAIELGCTNTSRGYQEVEITNLQVSSSPQYVRTNVELIEKENQLISLYPNPVHDILNINCIKDVNTIEVFDIMGSKKMIVNGVLGQHSIDVTKLSNGIYFLKAISQDNIVSTYKFVKN